MSAERAEITDIDEVNKEVRVTVPAEVFSQKYETAIKKVLNSAKIKGFRPGKAPRQVVERMYQKDIESDLLSEVVSDELLAIIKEKELDLVGAPDVSLDPLAEDKIVRFTAKFSVRPRPTIVDYDTFDVEVVKAAVTDEKLEEVVERMRERKAAFEPLTSRTAIQAGDVCELKVTVKLSGQDDSAPEPATVELGKGSLPPEVEKALEGKEAGQTIEMDVQVPEDHPAADLRGTQAHYTVEVIKLLDKKLPELSDETAEKIYPGATDLADLRAKVRNDLEQGSEKEAQDAVTGKIFNLLVERNSFMVPQPMIDDEIRALLVDQGFVDPKKVDVNRLRVERFRNLFGERALHRVRLRTVVDQIGAQEGVTVDESEIESKIGEIAEQLGIAVSHVHGIYNRPEMRKDIEDDMKRDKVLTMLRERAVVKFIDAPAEDAAKDGSVDAGDTAQENASA